MLNYKKAKWIFLFFLLLFFFEGFAQDSTIYFHGDCYLKSEIPLFEDSVKAINRAILSYPDSASLYSRRAHFYLSIFHPSLAKVDFARALELDSNNTVALAGMGWMAQHEKEFPLAEMYFRKALVTNKRRIFAVFLLGRVLYAQHKYQEALPLLLKVSENGDFGTYALFTIGKCYQKLDDDRNSKIYLAKTLTRLNEEILSDSSSTKNIICVGLSK